jgi:outer membrane protein TolC
MFRIMIILISFLLIWQNPIWADEKDLVSPDRLLKDALSNNSEIKAIESKIDSQKSKISASGKLMDARFSFEIQRLPAYRPYDFSGVDMYMFSISQEIPFFGKLKLKREIEEAILSKIEAESEKLKLEIALKVYNNFYRYYYLVKRGEILDSKIKLLEQLIELAEIRYTTNSMMQADILKMRSEVLMAKNELEMNFVEIKSVKSEINALIGRDSDSEIGYPADYIIDTNAVSDPKNLARLIEARPELKVIEREIYESKKRIDLSRSNYNYPDFMISGGYGLSPMMTDGLFFMVSVNLPWFNSKNIDETKMEEAMKREKEAMYLNMFRMAEAEVSSLYSKLSKLSSVIKNIESIMDLAQKRLELEKSQYEKGMGYLLNLIDALNDLYNKRLEYYEMKMEYSMIYTDLLRCCGLSPEKFIK